MDLKQKCNEAFALLDQIEAHAANFRKHQRLTATLLRGIVAGLGGGQWPQLASPGFLIEDIVPGGGKSYCAVMAASVLVGSGLFDACIWITPRTSLCRQARDDFVACEFALPTGRKFNPFNPAGLKALSIPRIPTALWRD